jgi:hypothetical protein
MTIRFLFDENVPDPLLSAVARHNLRGVDPIDAIQVGAPPDLPLGTEDPDILIWAEREGPILVSHDVRSLPLFLFDHVRAGHSSPGVFLIRRRAALREVVDFLVLAAYASESWEWKDGVQFIPL